MISFIYILQNAQDDVIFSRLKYEKHIKNIPKYRKKNWDFIILGVIPLDSQDFLHSAWKQKHLNLIVLLII